MIARHGKIDVLVNNASLVNTERHFLEADAGWWNRIIAVNLSSAFLCGRRAAQVMARAGAGCIINMASIAGLTGITGAPDYSAAKAGILSALVGSMLVMLVTACTAIPLGVAAGVYLEEYANRERWWNRLIELNIQNLAAVPSIIYGLLGLGPRCLHEAPGAASHEDRQKAGGGGGHAHLFEHGPVAEVDEHRRLGAHRAADDDVHGQRRRRGPRIAVPRRA